jgi:PEGA domain
MKRTSFFASAAVLVAIALGSAPAMAEDRNHDRGGRSHGESTEHGGGGDHNAVGRAVPRPEVVAPRVVRPTVVAPRVVAPRIVSPRRYGYPAYRSYGYPVFPSYGYPVYPSYGYRPYAFRPRTHFGFGIVIGYPVPYTYAYPYPVPVYGYAAPAAPVVVRPGSSVYGGVSLEMTPADAAVYVDGGYAGVVRDFDGTRQPLTLAAGTHRISVQEAGFQPLEFDVTVQAGQVIPYQGQLERY